MQDIFENAKFGDKFQTRDGIKRDDETDAEYQAAWHEEYKRRLQADVTKKGLTVYEINGELIPARNEREAQKRYKHRHK